MIQTRPIHRSLLYAVLSVGIIASLSYPAGASARSFCGDISSVIDALLKRGGDDILEFYTMENAAYCRSLRHDYRCTWLTGITVHDRRTKNVAKQAVKNFASEIKNCVRQNALPIPRNKWNRWHSKHDGIIRTLESDKMHGGKRYNRIYVTVKWEYDPFGEGVDGIELRVKRWHRK